MWKSEIRPILIFALLLLVWFYGPVWFIPQEWVPWLALIDLGWLVYLHETRDSRDQHGTG